MTSRLKTFLAINALNENRRQALDLALQPLKSKPVHVVILGAHGCPAHASSLKQLVAAASVTLVDSWADFASEKVPAGLLLFVEGQYHMQPDAVGEFLFAHVRGADVIYADSGVNPFKSEEDIFCKPAWSPELLLAFQYLGGMVGVDSQLFAAHGGFCEAMGPAQLYDGLLRFSETGTVEHLPRMLSFTSRRTASESDISSYIAACQKAITAALLRRHSTGAPKFTGKQQRDGQPTFHLVFPDDGPSVSILIASRNNVKILNNCLESLKKTTYKNYSVLVADNDSDALDMLAWLQEAPCRVIHVGRPGGRFNFSYVYNTAISQLNSDYVLLLNSDTEVIAPQWLSDMMGYARMPGVGSVGARLIFGNGTIQHCGICHNMRHGFPVTAFRHLPAEEDGYWQLSRLSCNHMAETAACLLTPRELYLRLGGLDEANFGVAFNDCDYGYRLIDSGYRNVLCPTAELYHFENATRGSGDNPREEAAYIRKYARRPDICHSPLYIHGEEGSRLSVRTLPTVPLPRLRLLMVMHDLTRTGACRNACYLARRFKERGVFEPIVLSHLDGPLRKELEDAGITVTIMSHFHMLDAVTQKQLSAAQEEMSAWVGEFKPDVVYGNTILTFWAMGAAARLQLPCVWNIRESESPFSHFDEHAPTVKPYAKACMAYPYKVVFVADATRALFEPYLNHNGMTIHNGFDRHSFRQQCSCIDRREARRRLALGEALYVLTVGTACERKGQKDILEAFAALPEEKILGCRLGLVCGDIETPYKDEMRVRIAGLPGLIRERIDIVNNPGNIDHHYMAADIFVCTSRIESFPRVIQEAMACSLPIITTPVFGVVEQVRDATSALFYPEGDIEKLARLLATLIDTPDMRRRLGKQAAVALDILPDFEDMVTAYERVIQEAWLSGGGTASATSL
ncbi:MAG: glycosyltransferase [Desulfarculales bacterium]|jgi:glycosyltransferase involved in cell wall biosynthesis|nr:glycosyltransferase [Desulfarculales bacterium]